MTTDVREAHLPKLDEHSRRETGNELQATLIEDLTRAFPTDAHDTSRHDQCRHS
jgi:hypothetical protein